MTYGIDEFPCHGREHRVLMVDDDLRLRFRFVPLDCSWEQIRAEWAASRLGAPLQGCARVAEAYIVERRGRRVYRRFPPYWVEGVVQRARDLVPRELVDDMSLSELVAFRRAHPVWWL